jgi:hypothetical protein
MIIEGPKNLLNISNKEATDHFNYNASMFLSSIQPTKNRMLFNIETYLRNKYHLSKPIKSLLFDILNATYLTTNNNNQFIIIIDDTKFIDAIDCSLDKAARIITYGNFESTGYPILLKAYEYASMKF